MYKRHKYIACPKADIGVTNIKGVLNRASTQNGKHQDQDYSAGVGGGAEGGCAFEREGGSNGAT